MYEQRQYNTKGWYKKLRIISPFNKNLTDLVPPHPGHTIPVTEKTAHSGIELSISKSVTLRTIMNSTNRTKIIFPIL